MQVATGTSTFGDGDCLPEVLLELPRPNFMAPSDTKLLERCIRGTTQNPNECINSMVWVRCLKHKHHGTKFVVYPAALAVCHFHKGAEYRKDIMNELSIHSETPTSHAFRLRDNNRLLKADTQAMAMEKKSHKAVQLVCT